MKSIVEWAQGEALRSQNILLCDKGNASNNSEKDEPSNERHQNNPLKYLNVNCKPIFKW